MRINLVSFSDFNSVIEVYDKEKMDLFVFMLVKIIEKGSKKTIKEVLRDLSVSEDLMYLYENNFYYLLDNKLIINKSDSEDISRVIVNDVLFSEFGKYCLKNNYIPKFREIRDLRIIYNMLDNKFVSDSKINDSSNVVVIDKSINFLNLINDNKQGLINEYSDNFVLNYRNKEANPYYYEINVNSSNISENLKKYLKDNMVMLSDTKLIEEKDKEFLSSNFNCVLAYVNGDNLVNSEYYLISDDSKEFKVEDNKLYISNINEFNDYSFVSLDKEVVGYKASKILLDDKEASVVSRNKLKDNKSDIKKYLVKNRDKFSEIKIVNKVIDLL